MNIEVLGILATLFATLSFSASSILYKKGEKGLSSFESNSLRCIFPFIALLITTIFVDKDILLSINFEIFTYIVLAIIIGLVIGDTLFFKSIKLVGVAIAVPSSSTFPIFTSIIATTFLNEVISIVAWFGIVLTLIGIWLLNRKNKDSYDLNVGKGIAFAISASILWSIGFSIFRYVLFNIDPFSLLIWRMVILFIFFIPLMTRSIKKVSFKSFLYLNLSGLVALAIGGILMFYGLAIIGASKSATITAANPLFSTILAIIFLKERIGSIQIFGILLLTIGILLVSLY